MAKKMAGISGRENFIADCVRTHGANEEKAEEFIGRVEAGKVRLAKYMRHYSVEKVVEGEGTFVGTVYFREGSETKSRGYRWKRSEK